MLTISDLRDRLNTDGLNYTAIARAARCSTKTLQRIRKGEQMPSLELASRISEVLSIKKAKPAQSQDEKRRPSREEVDRIVYGTTAPPSVRGDKPKA